MTWEDYEKTVAEIIAHIRSRHLLIEGVVGIARAGLPLLVSTASFLEIRDVGVLFIQRTTSDQPFAMFLPDAEFLGDGIPFPLQGRSVLLVDNVLHSGKTATKALNILRGMGAKVVEVASLARYQDEYAFQFFAPIKLAEDEWMIWPWDRARALEKGLGLATK